MSKPFDYFNYKKGELTTEGVSLNFLVKKFGTPLYVYSKKAFLDPLSVLQKELRELDPLICFAVKANSNLSVIHFLSRAGAGMDLVSGGELRRALKAQVQPEFCVFSGVGKTDAEILFALKHPLHSFNVESFAELKRLSDLAVMKKKRVAVALRFNPDVNPKTHPYISTGLKKNKFGMNKNEILTAVAQAKKFPGVKIHGLSIHIGSQILSLKPFDEAFNKLKELVSELEEKYSHSLQFLDLGGGLGISYGKEASPNLRNYARLILKHFGKKSKIAGRYRILLEPGRTLAGNAGVLVSKVLYRKKRDKKDFLILDAAMNDLMRPTLYGSHHEIVPVDQTDAKKISTDIVGPICESSDCFASDRKISGDLSSGDAVAILTAGAYGMSMSHTYNTRNRAAEVLVSDGQVKLIRKRETFLDQIRLEIL
jgi:diaminopimelate decarboxylase